MPGAAAAGRSSTSSPSSSDSSSSSSSGGTSQAAAQGAAGGPRYAPANLAPGSAPAPPLQQQADTGDGGAVDPEGNVLDGNTEVAAYPEEDDENGSTEGGSQQGSKGAAGQGAAQPGAEEQAPIKSPWSMVGVLFVRVHAATSAPRVNRQGRMRLRIMCRPPTLPLDHLRLLKDDCSPGLPLHCRRLRRWMRRRPAGRRPAASWRRSWARCTTHTCWCWRVRGAASSWPKAVASSWPRGVASSLP